MLACQQLGLAYDRETPQPDVRHAAPLDTPILMSWVSCEDVDLDLTKCKAINGDAKYCGHDKDVFLKCHRPTWAGRLCHMLSVGCLHIICGMFTHNLWDVYT